MQKAVIGGSLVTAVVGGIVNLLAHMMSDDPVTHSISFSEFKREARTGDLIIMSNQNLSITRVGRRTMWTHVGILVRNGDQLLEWSSHMNGEDELINTMGTQCGGTQLAMLDKMAAVYGCVYWKRVDLEDSQRRKLTRFINAIAYKTSFTNKEELLALVGRPFSTFFNGSSAGLACSHVVALTYMAADALGHDRHLTQYAPDSFAKPEGVDWLVPVGPVTMVVGFDTGSLVKLT